MRKPSWRKSAVERCMTTTFTAAALEVLQTADPQSKASRARELQQLWLAGEFPEIGNLAMPTRPARPDRPLLLAPRDMPRRRKGGVAANRVALLHAVAHIELNAIDLSVDIAGRCGPAFGRAFITDWLSVADDEARHFSMLAARLEDLGAAYGDLPAHDGLWEAAIDTSHDVCARLAVAHTVLEARGLDVTPPMIERLERHGDKESAEVLRIIHAEEVRHVRLGVQWFSRIAAERGKAPQTYWQELVRRYFKGGLKRPFNEAARAAAELPSWFYEPLAVE